MKREHESEAPDSYSYSLWSSKEEQGNAWAGEDDCWHEWEVKEENWQWEPGPGWKLFVFVLSWHDRELIIATQFPKALRRVRSLERWYP